MKTLKRIIAAALCWLAVSPAFAAYSFTSGNPLTHNNNGSFTTGSIAAAFNALTANTIVFTEFSLSSACTVTSVTDSHGLTWTVVAGASDGNMKLWAAYANNASAYGSTDYLTVNFSGTNTLGMINIYGELAGGPTSSPLGASNGTTGTSTTPSTSLTSVTSASAIISLTTNNGNSIPSAGSGYTLGPTGSGFATSYAYGAEYNLSSGSGTVAANYTISSSTWNVIALAFNPAPAGGSTSPSQMFLGASLNPVPLWPGASLWQRPVSLEAMARGVSP